MNVKESTVKKVQQLLEEQFYYMNNYESDWDNSEKNDLLGIFGIERDDFDPRGFFTVDDFIDRRF